MIKLPFSSAVCQNMMLGIVETQCTSPANKIKTHLRSRCLHLDKPISNAHTRTCGRNSFINTNRFVIQKKTTLARNKSNAPALVEGVKVGIASNSSNTINDVVLYIRVHVICVAYIAGDIPNKQQVNKHNKL